MRLSFLIFLLLLLATCSNNNESQTESLTKNENTKPVELNTLDSLIEVSPRNADYYYQRSIYYKNTGNLPKALTDAYSATYIDSNNVIYTLHSADLYLKLGKIDNAIQALKTGINNNKENENLYETIVEYSYYAKEYEQGLNFANDLLRINKFNANAYFFKGLIYKDLRNTEKAISNYQTCIEMDPQFYNAHMQLGLIYNDKGNETALQYFNNALRIDSNSREAKYAIAYFYQQNKQPKKAIETYKEMISKNPKDEELFFNVGYCYIDLDSLDKAYKNFDIATKIQPQYTGAYYMKAYVSELMNNKDEALKNYNQALKLLPNDTAIQQAIKRIVNEEL